MSIRPRSFDRLVESIARFPSVGPKTAARIALWLLNRPPEIAEEIAASMAEARRKIVRCRECFQFSEDELCRVCLDPDRDRSIICVVEETPDAWRIESTRRFRGLYHVLGGVLSPLDGVSIEDLHVDALVERIRSARTRINEVILATDFDTEGTATASYTAERLADTGVRITRLAYGLPAGGELAYTNETTIAQAIEGRSELAQARRE